MKKAILLAGGEGSRLRPLTDAINKSLLNLNGRAVVDYPLNTLKKMGVESVAIVLGGSNFEQVCKYLRGGERYGMSFQYFFQGEPRGISQAINLCKEFVENEDKFVCILGDNLYSKTIKWRTDEKYRAQIVLDQTSELERFGVASIPIAGDGKIVKIEEKPKHIDIRYDNYAISGCYQFDRQFFDFFKETKQSDRGEWEITDIINKYREQGSLGYTINSGIWFDAGTFDSIQKIEEYFHEQRKR